MGKVRMAKIILNGFHDDSNTVARYLPANYRVCYCNSTEVWIIGEDEAGWTLDDYVLPRLASGCLFGKEIPDLNYE